MKSILRLILFAMCMLLAAGSFADTPVLATPKIDAAIPIINYVIFFTLFISLVTLVYTKWPLVENTINSNNESPSLKRLVVFKTSMAVIVLSLISVLLKIPIPDPIWYGLLGVECGGLGLAVYEKVQMKKAETAATPAKDS